MMKRTNGELADALELLAVGVSGQAHTDLCEAARLLRAMPPEGERDHEAMETLRSASLKKGWKWQWDGMDLQQVTLGPDAPNTHKDPADAVLYERKDNG